MLESLSSLKNVEFLKCIVWLAKYQKPFTLYYPQTFFQQSHNPWAIFFLLSLASLFSSRYRLLVKASIKKTEIRKHSKAVRKHFDEVFLKFMMSQDFNIMQHLLN